VIEDGAQAVDETVTVALAREVADSASAGALCATDL
jgi:hypothetical protein